jgi:hypothetical protein
MQWRGRCYYKVMAFGRSPLGKLALRLHIAWADFMQFVCLIMLGFMEFVKEPFSLSIREPKSKKKTA